MSYRERQIGEIVGEEVWRSAAWLLISLCGTLVATALFESVPYNENTVVAIPTFVTVALTLSLVVYRVWTGSEARIL